MFAHSKEVDMFRTQLSRNAIALMIAALVFVAPKARASEVDYVAINSDGSAFELVMNGKRTRHFTILLPADKIGLLSEGAFIGFTSFSACECLLVGTTRQCTAEHVKRAAKPISVPEGKRRLFDGRIFVLLRSGEVSTGLAGSRIPPPPGGSPPDVDDGGDGPDVRSPRKSIIPAAVTCVSKQEQLLQDNKSEIVTLDAAACGREENDDQLRKGSMR